MAITTVRGAVLNRGINVKDYDAKGDGSTDDTDAIQAAIDYAAGVAGPNQKGKIFFPAGVYIVSGITLSDYIILQGDGHLATVIKLKDAADSDVVTVPNASAGNGIFDLTIDGNKSNNAAGNGLYFAATLSSTGDSYFPYRGKTTGDSDPDADAYKHFYGAHFVVGNCEENGIYNDGYGFGVFLTQFTLSYNDLHGLYAAGTDCEYNHAYVEKNGKAGIYCTTGAQKFTSIKIHWCNRNVGTHAEAWAGFHCVTTGDNPVDDILVSNMESQANYGSGFFISAEHSSFLGLVANKNGFLALASEDTSDAASSHFIFRDCENVAVIGHCFDNDGQTYLPGTRYLTEYPYTFTGSASTFTVFNISTDGNTESAAPSQIMTFKDADIAEMEGIKTAGAVLFDFDLHSDAGSDSTIRYFRSTEIDTVTRVDYFKPNTSTVRHRFNFGATAGQSITQMHTDDLGDFWIGSTGSGGAWNTSHLVLGPYHIWVDSTGDLRIKSSAPASDTDGTIVGTQS